MIARSARAIAAIERTKTVPENKHNVQPESLISRRHSLRHVGLYTLSAVESE